MIEVSDGVTVPQIGFGTFQIPPEDTQRAVETALELGYRHIDTAAGYYNESGVGAAIRASGLSDVFVTTKLRNVDHGYTSALAAFEASRQALGLEAIDLYLIHWPVPDRDLYVETWRAFGRLVADGCVRAIGVSNFLPEHLERIVAETGVTPAVNQFEVHPRFSQPELRARCAALGVTVEAYSPLGQGIDLTAAPVVAAAENHQVAPAQAVLAWHLQAGRIVIPKSTHADRMRQNLQAGDVTLSAEELAAIDALDSPSGRVGGDPATFAFPQTQDDAAARYSRS